MKIQAEQIEDFFQEISNYCPQNVTASNGNITIGKGGNMTQGSYVVRCDKGFGVRGSGSVTCVNGKYGRIGTCELIASTSKGHSKLVQKSSIIICLCVIMSKVIG